MTKVRPCIRVNLNCDNVEQAALRAKAGGQSGTYFEWRTPSASANPYLVLAGIVAAGLDGIKNQILPVSDFHEALND